MLGEDDELAAVAVSRRSSSGSSRIELSWLHLASSPVRTTSRASSSSRLRRGDLGLQLVDGARRGGLVEDLGFGCLDLVLREPRRRSSKSSSSSRRARTRRGRSWRRRASEQNPLLAQAALQALAPAAQRLVDGLGRRGQAALQDRQGEADVARRCLPRRSRALGAVELLADVVGDLARRGAPRRRRARTGRCRRVRSGNSGVPSNLSRSSLTMRRIRSETSAVCTPSRNLPSKRSPSSSAMKSWKSSSLPLCGVAVISRKWRQWPPTQLAELVALGVLDLAAEDVADILWASSQTTRSQLRRALSFSCTSSLRESLSRRAITKFLSLEPVAGARRLDHVVGEDLEVEAELLGQLVLPLLGEAARADDEAALEVAADDQLLDEQARHDGLAGAGVVGEQEAQRLARQHRLVDRRDLVRQRLDDAGGDRDVGIEEVRQVDAVRLGDEAEELAVAVEAPGAAHLDELEARLVVAVEEPVAELALGVAVDDLEGLLADPLDGLDGDDAGRGRARLRGFRS